eukprot:1536751-Prymnesium_polylepis.1
MRKPHSTSVTARPRPKPTRRHEEHTRQSSVPPSATTNAKTRGAHQAKARRSRGKAAAAEQGKNDSEAGRSRTTRYAKRHD